MKGGAAFQGQQVSALVPRQAGPLPIEFREGQFMESLWNFPSLWKGPLQGGRTQLPQVSEP